VLGCDPHGTLLGCGALHASLADLIPRLRGGRAASCAVPAAAAAAPVQATAAPAWPPSTAATWQHSSATRCARGSMQRTLLCADPSYTPMCQPAGTCCGWHGHSRQTYTCAAACAQVLQGLIQNQQHQLPPAEGGAEAEHALSGDEAGPPGLAGAGNADQAAGPLGHRVVEEVELVGPQEFSLGEVVHMVAAAVGVEGSLRLRWAAGGGGGGGGGGRRGRAGGGRAPPPPAARGRAGGPPGAPPRPPPPLRLRWAEEAARRLMAGHGVTSSLCWHGGGSR